MEKYSILMTVYKNDNPKFFDLSLKSIVQQSYLADQIVIVADGPLTIELQSVIDKYKADCPIEQIQLEVNKGLGLALNAGLAKCRNELIARMDSDDYSLRDRCKKQVDAFEEDQRLDIIGCQADEFIGEIDNIVGTRRVPTSNQEIHKFAKKRDPFTHPTVMYRKSKVEAAGGYSDYRKNQDTDLWIKMLSNGAYCRNLDSSDFRFRFDEGTYKRRKSWINTKILIEIRYKAWKRGFNSFFEFIQVAIVQLGIYILPVEFQKFLYKKVLRR